jgi:muramoyltetrapeptide carboxypeptidase
MTMHISSAEPFRRPVKKPRALRAGDTIAFVSPASPVKPEEFVESTELFVQSGYRVKVYPHAWDRSGYLAGPDEARASDLQSAFDDPEAQAVYCTRGGYGCSRLLPLIDFDRMARAGKLFIGFSDITVLHLALNRRGLPTLHGPMALTLHYAREPWVYDSLLRALKGDLTVPPEAGVAETAVGGKAVGQTVGGCLCLLCDTLATCEPLDTQGKILFIEDVDEAPHRIDAMFTHLLNTGQLQSAAGIVVGEMTRTDEKGDAAIGIAPWREIVREKLLRAGVPAVIGYQFGHVKGMLTVGLGVEVELDADAGTIRYLEGVCET